MEARLDYTKASPEAFKAMVQMEGVVRRSGIDPKLLELIKIRASQLNGCAFCIDMHTKDARFKGESEQRIYALDAWRETPFYTERERAALAWTEALTNIQIGHAPDAVYEELQQKFQRRGDREPNPRDHHHQRVESHRDRLSISPRQLSAECVPLSACGCDQPGHTDETEIGLFLCTKPPNCTFCVI